MPEGNESKELRAIVAGSNGESKKGDVEIKPGVTVRDVKEKIIESAEVDSSPEMYDLRHKNENLRDETDLYQMAGDGDKVRLQPNTDVASKTFLFLFFVTVTFLLFYKVIKIVYEAIGESKENHSRPKGDQTEKIKTHGWEESSNLDVTDFTAKVDKQEGLLDFTKIISRDTGEFKDISRQTLLKQEFGWEKKNGNYEGEFKINEKDPQRESKRWYGEAEVIGNKFIPYIYLDASDYEKISRSEHSGCFTKKKNGKEDFPRWVNVHFNGKGTSRGKPKSLSSAIQETQRYLNEIFGGDEY